jgi:orotate phosphoribosyltransferase
MDRATLAARLTDACLLTGSFVLRSGQVSETYFDKYQFESQPELLEAVARQLAPLVPPDTEVLAGLEMGGIPIATALGFVTRLPVAFVRKEAKQYGTARLAEGTDIAGRRALVVEDVVTTGGQVAISTNDLRERGAIIDTALCVINRSGRDVPAALAEADLALLSLFTFDELRA